MGIEIGGSEVVSLIKEFREVHRTDGILAILRSSNGKKELSDHETAADYGKDITEHVSD